MAGLVFPGSAPEGAESGAAGAVKVEPGSDGVDGVGSGAVGEPGGSGQGVLTSQGSAAAVDEAM